MVDPQALCEILVDAGVPSFLRRIPTCSVHPGGNGGGPNEFMMRSPFVIAIWVCCSNMHRRLKHVIPYKKIASPLLFAKKYNCMMVYW